jgi:ABC-2 type transport system permease protein
VNSFAGTGTLVRFILRRDRLRLPIWIGGIVGFSVAVVMSFPGIYPTEVERQARARLMEHPVSTAFRGPGHGLEDYTIGAIVANELMIWAAIAVALMSIFLVVRHTRAEEESGRLELVRAAVVGRYAAPTAALVVVFAANIVIGGLLAIGLTGLVEELPWRGSLAFGMATAAIGLVFAGVAVVAAQMTEHSRGASSVGTAVLGAAFVLRAIGDVQGSVLSWLSPIGWSQATRAYVDERWWPLLISLAVALVLPGFAFALNNRRDVAAGLLPQQPGPATASKSLAHPAGLAFRLQRGGLAGWSVGLLVLGGAFGSLAGAVDDFVADNPQLVEFLEGFEGASVLDAFFAMLVMILAMLSAVFGIQTMLRPRTEEIEGRAEPLLATALSRLGWLGGYLIVALGGSILVVVAGSLGLGLMAGIDQGDISLVTRLLGAGLAYVPAIWLVIGLVAALFGLAPRAVAAGWLLFAFALFVGLFGDLLRLPEWMFNLSPYEHAPQLPGGEVQTISLVLLMGIAAALIVAGLAGFRRRDLDLA